MAAELMTEQFEAIRKDERIIADALWALRPNDGPWEKIVYERLKTGGVAGDIAYIYGREAVTRKSPPYDVVFAADRLRQALYRPGAGAWLSMTLTVTPAGDGWEASYNYMEKPVWELGDPSADAYAQELYLFPRDPENIPSWFAEELKGAKWRPPAA